MELTGDKSAPHIRVVDYYLAPIIQNVIKRNERDMDAGTENKDPDEDITLLDHLVRLTSDPLHRLREEILQVIGPTRHPTCDDVRDMKFLQAVIDGK